MVKEKNDVPKPTRTYKARLFEMIFSEPKELLKLYNAINGTNYQDEEKLEVNTLRNAIYMSMHNDISFVIDSRLTLYEHQSTYSPNLPLRFLLYVSDLYSSLTREENLYGTKPVDIPAPKFIIFYNGVEEKPDMQVLKLSDMYTRKDEPYALELEAVLININQGHNLELMEACKTLSDYAEYTSRVRAYAEELPLEQAVEQTITECIEEDILADFLKKNRAEAKSVSIYEYDEEKHLRQEREAGMEIGIQALIQDNLEEGKSKEVIIEKLIRRFHVTDEAANRYFEKFSET